jgi:hypothetical protein
MPARSRRGPREGGGGSVLMFARVRSRIEAAAPLPRIGVVRIAAADRDRADTDIAVVDVPAIWPFGISPAGESGHAALERGLSGSALVSGPVVSRDPAKLKARARRRTSYLFVRAKVTSCRPLLPKIIRAAATSASRRITLTVRGAALLPPSDRTGLTMLTAVAAIFIVLSIGILIAHALDAFRSR